MWEILGTGTGGWSASLQKVRSQGTDIERDLRQQQMSGPMVTIAQGFIRHDCPKMPNATTWAIITPFGERMGNLIAQTRITFKG